MASLATTPTSGKGIFSPPSTPPIKRRKIDPPSNGCTILLTGLSGSGKSTLSNQLTPLLKNQGILVKQLDGKELRAGLCKDFAGPLNRSHFVHLASEAAKLFTKEGFITIISTVAPLSEDRKNSRDSHEKDGLRFLEVFVDRPRAECDAVRGLSKNVLHPIDADYEQPLNPDLHLQISGKNPDALTRELLDELISYKLIPPQFLPPQSPFSPMQPTPSPSTTLDSSGLDLDDNDNSDDDNDETTPFKLPKKGSAILAIFNHVKAAMVSRGFVGKDEQVDKDALFFDIMSEWKQHYDSHVGEERFFPTLIPQPSRKQATPSSTPKKGQDNFIPLYWDGTTIRYGKIGKKQIRPGSQKCPKCWQAADSCPNHSTTNVTHFAILKDTDERTTKIILSLEQQNQNKMAWDKELVAKWCKHSRMTLVSKYLDSHPTSKFTEIYAKSMLVSSSDRHPIMHTIRLSTAMICLFRNIERVENDAPIQPHVLLQSRLDMGSANLAVLQTTLEENGIIFTTNDDDDDKTSTSPLVNNYCWKLPSVYMGTKGDNKINIGLKVSQIGTDTHSASHEQRGETFTSGTLYQTPLTDEQLEVANSIPVGTPKNKWTQAQQDLHKLVEDDCRRKEALGISTLVLAEMLGGSRNGHPVIRDNKRFEHINTTKSGDLLYIQQVFKLLTGLDFTTTVTISNDLSFNDAFFP